MTTIQPGPTPGFDVDTTVLAAHQQQLGAVLDQLADALRVALDTHLPEEAFGPFGRPLAQGIKPTAAAAQSAFERAVESVGAKRDGMDVTVRTYDAVERENASLLASQVEPG